MANDKVDVVIVGAGASGSVFAAVLAKAGRKVVLLEAGPDWQLDDLISSDIWGRRIKPAGPPFLLEGKNPYGYVYQAGWGTGGAALHYFANFPRLLPDDFKVKSTYGKGLDWPIDYADIAPYWDKVADDVGVSGNAKAEEIWRPPGKPYPMPPMRTFPGGDAWKKGFEALGMRLTPAAVGINSTTFKGRPACIYDGWCHVGCPISALSNPLVTYLAEARQAGAEVRPYATVTAPTERRRQVSNITTRTNKSRFRKRAWSSWLHGRRRTRASCLAPRPTSTRTDLPIQGQIPDGAFRLGDLGIVR
jgi:choline dehydrogenase-like flavoprotein